MKHHPSAYTLSERSGHLEQWKTSGLGLPAYSKECGVPLTCLRYWAYGSSKHVRTSTSKPARFLPIALADEYSAPEAVLELPNGIRLTLRGDFSASYLKALIS